MPHVLWATIATANPMGQQHYESAVQAAIRALAPQPWTFEAVPVGGLRSAAAGARRSPGRWAQSWPLEPALLLGAALYRTRALVHRFDLRLPPHPGPEVVTVHDLPPARFADEGSMARSTAASARRARAVITPSAFAAAEARELLGVERTVVVPNGVSQVYRDAPSASDRELRSLGIDRPFLLHAAGASARKNLAGLAGAWRLLTAEEQDLQLVLCGPPDRRRDDAFRGLPRVLLPGRLPALAVAGLMRRAQAVMVPSLYEGFGLPALEGLACGAPVVASDRGALPEVCGGAAVLVPPHAEALADGVRRVLQDTGLADRLRAQGPAHAAPFTWERSAQGHLAVYRAALQV